ncbi:MAG: hypothetical protein JNL33_16370 [Betaproteobacteria bacterium]|nr:hypothetical protein [Betaproteobacteria bacterium]
MPRRPRLAKLTRPKLRHAVDRPRLFAMLDDARMRPVTWLAGPPGSGKTTLLSTYVAARRCGHLWYDLDSGDADPASWFQHLREAAMALSASNRRLSLFTPDYLPAPEAFARRFFRQFYGTLPSGSLLVFDDYHEIPAGAPVHELFAIAFEEMPEGTSIVVVSREDPPPALAVQQARERLGQADGLALALTEEESRTVAKARARIDETTIASIHRASRGWAAGFTLMLDLAGQGPEHAAGSGSLEAVFAYFAGTVLERLPPADRRALQQVALLPRFTLDMARALTCRPDIGKVVEDLRRRRLFIVSTGPQGHWREFHGLLREFLLGRLREETADPALRETVGLAAALLEQAGMADEALEARLGAMHWQHAAELLVRAGEAMIAQGRWHFMLAALERLPASQVAGSAWLRYWQGRALSNTDPPRARRTLFEAAAAFERQGDFAGQGLALAASIQLDLSMDHGQSGWTGTAIALDHARSVVRTWASPDHEAVVLSAWMLVMQHVAPSHPEVSAVARRVASLAETSECTGGRARCVVQALISLVNVGDFATVRRLSDVLGRVAQAATTSVPDRVFILTYLSLAQYGLFLRFDDALGSIAEARSLAAEHGLHWAEIPLLQFEAEIHLYTNRDPAAGRAVLERIQAAGIGDATIGAVFYHCAAAHGESWNGNPAAALEHARRGLWAARQSSPSFFLLFGRWVIHLYADGQDEDGARTLMSHVEQGLAGTCFEASSAAVMAMQRAYLALAGHDRPAAHAELARALRSMNVEPSTEAPVYWMGRGLAVLLAEALAHGIEPDVARSLIRRLDLPPPAGRTGQAWPWPVSVRTLGAFEVRRFGVTVAFGRKVPRKTLALLKALIAFGGSDVREERLIDALWPDEEGDDAHGAYTMAVVRLRRLLGDPRVLVQRGKTLSLDRTRCHVDLWETDGSQAAGDFLPGDDDAPWAEPVRRRLRKALQTGTASD